MGGFICNREEEEDGGEAIDKQRRLMWCVCEGCTWLTGCAGAYAWL